MTRTKQIRRGKTSEHKVKYEESARSQTGGPERAHVACMLHVLSFDIGQHFSLLW